MSGGDNAGKKGRLGMTPHQLRNLGSKLLSDDADYACAPYAFPPGSCWAFCPEYCIPDLEAEVGLFVGLLGFKLVAFERGYALLANPAETVHLAFRAAEEGKLSTLGKLCFMVDNLSTVEDALAQKGIELLRSQTPKQGASIVTSTQFRSPSGLVVEIWGSITASY